MNVEKCPYCGIAPDFKPEEGFYTLVVCGCGSFPHFGVLPWQAKIIHNRWARSEARRIERGGANQ